MENNESSKRWIIAAAGVAMQLCLGSVYAWSIFKKPLMETHGWAETIAQGPFMIQAAMFALSVAFGGTIVDRKGPRFTGFAGAVLFSAGLFIAGYANFIGSVPLLYIGYGVIVGLGGGLGYSAPIATLIRWFPDKRGLVTGLAVMGYGLGSFLMGNIGPKAILDEGITRTFFGWGIVSAILVTGSVAFLKNPPVGFMQAEFHGQHNVNTAGASFTFEQAIRTWQYPILWLMLFLNITAGLGFISQLSPMAHDVIRESMGTGITPEMMKKAFIMSGKIVGIAAIFNGLGRLAWAWVSDAIGRRTVFIIILALQAAGYSVIGHSTGIMMFSMITCALLACYGGMLSTLPAFTADQYGAAHIGKIYGVIFTACGAAGICGPFLFAKVKEMTGSFQTALYIETGLLLLGLLLIVVYRKPEQKREGDALKI